ncbi:MAG TPA: type II toxin-antitoxin system RelE/ParE family toxin [Acidobacteriaceae bacterium]|nr:type II toxin-antitoxin system RelE/ParE family toxin [Acidobacteriaceae bacterium]
MSFPVRYTRQASHDLTDGAACLQQSEGEPVATRFVDMVARMTRSLEGSPTLGTPCDMHSVRRRDLKRLALPAPFAAWKIYYAVLFSELRIERILHMAPQPLDAQQTADPGSASA